MSVYTQKGSVQVDAFQYTGGLLPTYVNLPIWAKRIALHTPGDDTLHVPTRSGVEQAKKTDWVVQDADGSILVVPNKSFILLYS